MILNQSHVIKNLLQTHKKSFKIDMIIRHSKYKKGYEFKKYHLSF